MTDNILYMEMFDGDDPPVKDAYKNATAIPKEAPEIDGLLKGSSTGASKDIERKIEIDDLTNMLAPGAVYAPVRKESEPLLTDDLFQKFFLNPEDDRTCKCSCAKCLMGKCAECKADKKCAMYMASQPKQKATKLAKMAKYDRGVSPIVERFQAKLGTLDGVDDDYWQGLIDHCAEFVAESVQHA